MQQDEIGRLRQAARQLVRELGVLQLSGRTTQETPQQWHALIEIAKTPNITISQLSHILLFSVSTMSRIVKSLIKEDLLAYKDGPDKREKYLFLTAKGKEKIKEIDEYSNTKIKGAFKFLNTAEQKQIVHALEKYVEALEKSRLLRENIRILTLSTSRVVRKQIVSMIENIQKNEFKLSITKEINSCILKAETEFYYRHSYNFWYAVDNDGKIIGSIGLKKINDHYGEIKKFFIEESYRGTGLAMKLMDVLTKAALRHGFDYLILGTVGSLEGAQKFYQKHGFLKIDKKELPAEFILCPLDNVFFKIDANLAKNHFIEMLT